MSLKIFFDEILSSAPIDYAATEMKDIIDAVGEMVERYSRRITERNPELKITRVLPRGSMVDKTALWKTKAIETSNADWDEDEISSDDSTDKITSDKSTDKITSDKSMDQIITDESTDKISSDNGMDETTSDEGLDEITSDAGLNKITSDKGMEEITSDEGMEINKSKESMDKITSGEATYKTISENVMGKIISHEVVDKNRSDKDTEKISSNEDKHKFTPDEGIDKFKTRKGSDKMKSDVATNSISSDESTCESSSDEDLGELISGDDVIRVTYEPYIEFDFLAVLCKPRCFTVNTTNCPGCKQILGNYTIDLSKTCVQELDNVSHSEKPKISFNPAHPDEIMELMHYELWTSSVSFCTCSRITSHSNFHFKTTSMGNCENCIIDKPTGYLQVANGCHTRKEYSICLVWKSKIGSLFAPDVDSLQLSRRLDEIPIHIDFIPAYEILTETTTSEGRQEHDCFLVAKRCASCDEQNTWRASYCVKEIDHFTYKVSSEHKKCFMLIKYLFEQLNIETEYPGSGTPTPLKSYEAKSAVLNHNGNCTANPDQYHDCVVTILQELSSCYLTGQLNTYINKTNIAPSCRHQKSEMTNRLLLALQKIDNLNVYSPVPPDFRSFFIKECTEIIMEIARMEYFSSIELAIILATAASHH